MFLFGLWPRFLGFVLFSAVCFAVSAGETQVWLGDLRVVAFCVVVVFVLLLQSICLFQGLFVLVQSFVCLLSCKDRAISATSATLEEKKNGPDEVHPSNFGDSSAKVELKGQTSILGDLRELISGAPV